MPGMTAIGSLVFRVAVREDFVVGAVLYRLHPGYECETHDGHFIRPTSLSARRVSRISDSGRSFWLQSWDDDAYRFRNQMSEPCHHFRTWLGKGIDRPFLVIDDVGRAAGYR